MSSGRPCECLCTCVREWVCASMCVCVYTPRCHILWASFTCYPLFHSFCIKFFFHPVNNSHHILDVNSHESHVTIWHVKKALGVPCLCTSIILLLIKSTATQYNTFQYTATPGTTVFKFFLLFGVFTKAPYPHSAIFQKTIMDSSNRCHRMVPAKNRFDGEIFASTVRAHQS